MARLTTNIVSLSLIITIISAQQSEKQQIQSYKGCRTDQDCKEYSFCYGNDDNKPGKCKCLDGFELNRNLTFYECLEAVNLGAACQKNMQCMIKAGPLAQCSRDKNTCECNEMSHRYTDGICYLNVKLTEFCLTDPNCLMDNNALAACVDGRCVCPLNHQPAEDLMSCLLTRKLGDVCKSEDDCRTVKNSICQTTCTCNINHIISRNESICLPAATQFGEPCDEDGQCSKHLTKGVCNNNVCTCAEGLHAFGADCMPTRRVDESCSADGECIYHRNLTNNVKCQKGRCNCLFGTSKEGLGCKLSASFDDDNSSARIHITLNQIIVIGLCFLLIKF